MSKKNLSQNQLKETAITLPGLSPEKNYSPIIKREETEEKAVSTGKYKRSGHLTDQLLKYNYPKGDKGSALYI